jgi:glyceraldehyde 3-phosphate dehydrogenase
MVTFSKRRFKNRNRMVSHMVKIAINGYGRIGREIVRAVFERKQQDEFEIVAINDLAEPRVSQHLTQFDSTHGRFSYEVKLDNNNLVIGNQTIKLLSEKDPARLPWSTLGVDLVMECTGKFKKRASLLPHLTAGAARVLVSCPVADADYMVVYGVNHKGLNAAHKVVSNASCTTNCLAPVAKVLDSTVGIKKGFMTTIHAYTNDQNLLDKIHSDLYRARSATQSMIPTKTGAAGAVGKVLPELDGKLDGLAVRVPTANVSLVDLVFTARRETSVEEINTAMKAACREFPKGLLEYNDLPLVSIDFNHNPASAIFDASQTRVNGDLVKIMAWYDNEWGFSNRMLDVAALMA